MFLLLVAAPLCLPAADSEGAWQAVERLRDSLVAASPLVVPFSQTFTPAGFSSGDMERGVMSLQLPDCARWDYEAPFPRTYLLCGETAYSWNEGETSGRRFDVSSEESAGLDLLRLDATALRQKYVASQIATDTGLEISLEPLSDEAQIIGGRLSMDTGASRLLEVSFSDFEGNLTVFGLGEPAPPGSGVASPFDLPPGIEWID